MSKTNRLIRRLLDHDRRLAASERASQVAARSLDGAAMKVYDDEGNVVQEIGMLEDGHVGVVDRVATAPAAPSVFVAEGGEEAVTVRWDGEWAEEQPAQVTPAYVGVHLLVPVDEDDEDDVPLEVAAETEVARLPVDGGAMLVPADAEVPVEVLLVTVSAAGVWSEPTSAGVVTPRYPLQAEDVQTTDGLPPSVSPTPEVIDGIGLVWVRLPVVEEIDPITVKVYASRTSDVTDDAHLLEGVVPNGGTLPIGTLGGVPLEAGETVYVVARADDADGQGPVSAAASGTVLEVGFEQVSQAIKDQITAADGKASDAQAAAAQAIDDALEAFLAAQGAQSTADSKASPDDVEAARLAAVQAAAADAQSKANAAQAAAEAAAAADAAAKAAQAKADALAEAATDAQSRADAARAQAEATAAADAAQKANAAQAAAEAKAQDAQDAADAAATAAATADDKATSAQSTADSKASPDDVEAARLAAVQAAAADAQSKADAAQAAATAAAAADAQAKANAAAAAAEQAAKDYAEAQASGASDAAIAAAAADAQAKADAAQAAAEAAAAADAQAKADAAQAAAAADASSKADAARAAAEAKAAEAQEAADAAAQAAATADGKAVAAQGAASAALDTANSKGKVIVGSSTPPTADRLAQNLWIDTSPVGDPPVPGNIAKRWDGSAWVVVQDAGIQAAAAAAAAAQQRAEAAIDAASQAQLSADGKSRVRYGPEIIAGQVPTTPAGTADGDTYFGRKETEVDGVTRWATTQQWRRVSGEWVSEVVDGQVIANLDAGSITTGTLNVALLLEADTILARLAALDEVTAEMLAADFLTANDAFINALRVADFSGVNISGTNVNVAASLLAYSLTVQNDLTIEGLRNRIGSGSGVTVAAGISRPQRAPQVERFWPSRETPMSFLPAHHGYCRNIANTGWVVGTAFFGGRLDEHLDAGGTTFGQDFEFWNCEGGVTRIGSNYYGLGVMKGFGVPASLDGRWFVYRFNAALERTGQWEWVPSSAQSNRPAIGNDGTNIVIAWSNMVPGSNNQARVVVRRFTTSGADVDSTVCEGGLTNPMAVTSVHWGSESGAPRIILTGQRALLAYNTSGVRQTASEWLLAGLASLRGMGWNGQRFVHIDDAGFEWTYSTLTVDTTRDVDYSWYRSAGPNETLRGPSRSFVQRARSYFRVVTDAPYNAGVGYPDRARVWINDHAQALPAAGETVSTYELPATGGGAKAPDFPAGGVAAGYIASEIVAGWRLNGDGTTQFRTPTAPSEAATKEYVDLGRGYARHSANASQSIPNNTETRLRLPDALEPGQWSYNDGSTRRDFTCLEGGVYTITFSWLWQGNSTGIRTGRIAINDVPQPERTSQVPNHAASLGQQVVITRRFSAGDVVYLEVRQTSGGSIITDPTANATFVKQGV